MVLHDKKLRFMCSFWTALFELLGTCIVFSGAFHPQADS